MTTFTGRLGELMNDRGVSLLELARQLPVDKSYLSRVRNGHRPPSAQLAEALDRKLGADGELIALGAASRRLWRSERLAEQLDGAFSPEDEERLVSSIQGRRVDDQVLTALATVLEGQRHLEDLAGPSIVVSPVTSQLRQITAMLRSTRGRHHQPLGRIVTEWTYYAGWLHVAMQQHRRALGLFDVASELSTDFRHQTLAAQVTSMRGFIARHRGRYADVVSASAAAATSPGSHPAQRIFDSLQTAYGYAGLGQSQQARRLVNHAAERIDIAGEPPPAVYWYTRAFLRVYSGIVHLELGSYRDAVDLLQSGIDHMPAEQRNAEWMAGYRDALTVARTRM